ncbi:hypothetical protein [Gaoshiqia sp. Z1-71]|uniref:hypothetical protein n=1 Tax=Gaoshiqia hydrogeniformans TaxID=3290090 RepID=UPI003BF875D3
MTNKPGVLHFQIIQSNIDLLYMRLGLSLNNILKMLENENDFKGFYNPKKYKIIDCDDVGEFTKFQSTIKGLNNYIYYNSLVLSSYSVFEHSLKLICNFIDKYFVLPEKFIDKPIDILGNCMKYIKRTQLVDFGDTEIDKIYMQIKKVNKLRNLIAHYNGNLIKDRSKPLKKQTNYNLFKSDKRLIIIGNGQIYIDNDEYISSFVEESEKFLNLIIKQIKNNC